MLRNGEWERGKKSGIQKGKGSFSEKKNMVERKVKTDEHWRTAYKLTRDAERQNDRIRVKTNKKRQMFAEYSKKKPNLST